MLKLLLKTFAFAFIFQKAASQAPAPPMQDTIIVQSGFYTDAINPESPLYNGPEHQDYHPHTIGNPFFKSLDWMPGTIYSKGLVYKNVPMKYDLVKDRVVIRHHNGFYKVELLSQQVDSFLLAGHTFLRLQQNKEQLVPKTGFYEVVYTPTINLLIKRENWIVEFIDNSVLARRVDEKVQLFADKEGARYAINDAGDLLNLMPEHKKAVQRHLKKSKIRFRKNKILAAYTAIAFYNQQNTAN